VARSVDESKDELYRASPKTLGSVMLGIMSDAENIETKSDSNMLEARCWFAG